MRASPYLVGESWPATIAARTGGDTANWAWRSAIRSMSAAVSAETSTLVWSTITSIPGRNSGRETAERMAVFAVGDRRCASHFADE